MSDASKPAHCPDGHDEKFWVHLVGQPCDPATHEDLDRAWHAARAWLDGVVDASFSSTIGQVHLPSSTAVPLGVDASAVDPSQAYLVLARARRGDEPTDAIYIGLVGQTVTGTWRGLTGFYLPYCGECQELGVRVAEILDWMPQEAVALDPQRLPQAIRPRDGWFEDRMLLGIKLNGVGTDATDSTWCTWRPDVVTDATAAALVCCGPMMHGLANIVFTDSLLADLPALLSSVADQLAGPPAEPVVSVREGSRETLLSATGGLRSHPDGEGAIAVTVSGRVTRSKLPADWGVYVIHDMDGKPGVPLISRSLDGTAHMLRATGSLGVPGSTMTAHYWPREPGVVAWDHLLQLGRRVAQ